VYSTLKISSYNEVDTQIIHNSEFQTGQFRIDHVAETYEFDLLDNSWVYRVVFSGPALTTTGKDHARNRQNTAYTTGSAAYGVHPELSTLSDEMRELIRGPEELKALALKALKSSITEGS
jgi:hypothetical protein